MVYLYSGYHSARKIQDPILMNLKSMLIKDIGHTKKVHSEWSQLYEILPQATLTYGIGIILVNALWEEGVDWEAAWKDFLQY